LGPSGLSIGPGPAPPLRPCGPSSACPMWPARATPAGRCARARRGPRSERSRPGPGLLAGHEKTPGPSARGFPVNHLGHLSRLITSVEVRGFEPLTFCMPCRRATNCAIPPEWSRRHGHRPRQLIHHSRGTGTSQIPIPPPLIRRRHPRPAWRTMAARSPGSRSRADPGRRRHGPRCAGRE